MVARALYGRIQGIDARIRRGAMRARPPELPHFRIVGPARQSGVRSTRKGARPPSARMADLPLPSQTDHIHLSPCAPPQRGAAFFDLPIRVGVCWGRIR